MSSITVTLALENRIVFGAASPEKVSVLPIKAPPSVSDPKLAEPATKLRFAPKSIEKLASEWMPVALTNSPSTPRTPGGRGLSDSTRFTDPVFAPPWAVMKSTATPPDSARVATFSAVICRYGFMELPG